MFKVSLFSFGYWLILIGCLRGTLISSSFVLIFDSFLKFTDPCNKKLKMYEWIDSTYLLNHFNVISKFVWNLYEVIKLLKAWFWIENISKLQVCHNLSSKLQPLSHNLKPFSVLSVCPSIHLTICSMTKSLLIKLYNHHLSSVWKLDPRPPPPLENPHF